MKRKWLKRSIWIALTPVFLFVLLMALLYVPPVQSFLRKQATAIASDATGMDISVDRIDLRFPLNLLVRGVRVVQPAGPTLPADTLLSLNRLNIHIQAWPLLKGQVEIDGIRLQEVNVNSARLLEGMHIKGSLGDFSLESHGVDLPGESVTLNQVSLADTRLHVTLADTASASSDTLASSAPLNWKVWLHTLKLKNISVGLSMPLDSMNVSARLGDVCLEDAVVNLKEQLYAWRRFQLQNTTVNYDTGNSQPLEGFDASHIALRDLNIGIDSVLAHGKDLKAIIRQFSLNERSGLSVTSLTGRLEADSSVIRIPSLQLSTPHSLMSFTAQTYWQLVNIPTTGRLTARLHANIGKQDVLLFAGALPKTFQEAYPFRPLVIRAGTEGNLKQMQLSGFSIDLPGAFSLKGAGELWNLTDSLKRSAQIRLAMETQDLNFLTGLTGVTPDGSLVIPDSMRFRTQLQMEGSKLATRLQLRERQGTLNLHASYDISNNAYQADLQVDSLQLHHFLPKDSIYRLSATLTAQGQGLDLKTLSTHADAHLKLDELQYDKLNITAASLNENLNKGQHTAR